MKQVRYPDSWHRRRLKFVADVSTSNVDKHIHDDEIPARLCNYTDVYYNRVITEDMELSAGSVTTHELKRFGLRRGQVLMTKDSESWDDIAVPAYVSQDMPKVVCGYHLAVVEPLGDELDGEFFCWAAQTDTINDHYKLEARGVTRFGLGHYALKNVDIGFPPIDRQLAVNAFLREKTTEIDDLISKKRDLLGLLAEKRSALITRAVTKGVDPTAPMKPSGIDWLGDIPAHWDARRFRFLISAPFKYGANEPAELEDPDFPRYIRITDVKDDGTLREDTFRSLPPEIAEPYLLQEGDILLARSGATVGKSFKYERSWGIAAYAGYLIRARLSEVMLPDYAKFFLHSQSYWQWVEGSFIQSTIQNISAEKYSNLWLPLPPLDEQSAIVDTITEGVIEIDRSVDLVRRAIDQLTEYRAAIITKAVTGELEVA